MFQLRLQYISILIFLGLINKVLMEENCEERLNTFAQNVGNFTTCTIINSRPITLCEDCVEHYINLLQSYQQLQRDGNSTCIENFVNLDRLQILQTQLDNSKDLWETAKCSDCHQIIDGVLTRNQSAKMIKFNELHKLFDQCVNKTDIDNTTLCPTCMQTYLNLDNYYRSITDENLSIGVCMDMVDIMNTTRSFWSPKCCKFRKHREYLFIGCTITVLFATAAFYLLVQLCAERKVPTILQQSRFAAFLQTNDCIVNEG